MIVQVHVGAGSMLFESFSMANTAITSNRAVPGENMALEYKYATQILKENAKPFN